MQESWDEASDLLFKPSISKAEWVHTISLVRRPLGKLLSRTLESASPKYSLPGAPGIFVVLMAGLNNQDSEYVLCIFKARYVHKMEALETVTPLKEPDGGQLVSYDLSSDIFKCGEWPGTISVKNEVH